MLLDDAELVLDADDALEVAEVLDEFDASRAVNTVSSAFSSAAKALLADVLLDVEVVELVSELSLVADAKIAESDESIDGGGGP